MSRAADNYPAANWNYSDIWLGMGAGKCQTISDRLEVLHCEKLKAMRAKVISFSECQVRETGSLYQQNDLTHYHQAFSVS